MPHALAADAASPSVEESAVLRTARGARLSGEHHLRLRRSGAAGAAVRPSAGARAREPDRGRSGGDARLAVAGTDRGGARQPASPAGSRAAVRDWRSFRAGSRWRGSAGDRDRRLAGLALRRAPARAVGHVKPSARRWISTTSKAIWRRCSRLGGRATAFSFRSRDARPACTRAAARACCASGGRVGWLGELHPASRSTELDLTYAPVLFELDL